MKVQGLGRASEFQIAIRKLATGGELEVLQAPSKLRETSVGYWDEGRMMAVAAGPDVTCFDAATGPKRAPLKLNRDRLRLSDDRICRTSPLADDQVATELVHCLSSFVTSEARFTRGRMEGCQAADRSLDDRARAKAIDALGLPMAHYQIERGRRAIDEKKLDTAFDAYDEAHHLNSADIVPVNSCGNAWSPRGQLDQGLGDYDCLDVLAAADAEAGDFAEAAKWQAKAIQLSADDQRAEYQSRVALYRERKPDREPLYSANQP